MRDRIQPTAVCVQGLRFPMALRWSLDDLRDPVSTVVPPYVQFCFLQLQLPEVSCSPEASDPPPEASSEGHSSPMLHHRACITRLTSAHHTGILSSPSITEGTGTTEQNILRGRETMFT